MNSKLNPYLGFDGKAKEAMEFYKNVFGGTLTLTTFGENKVPAEMGESDKIMHAMLVADNGITLMGSDTPKTMPYKIGATVSISLSGDDEAELKGYWDKLAEGAKIEQPLTQAPWGDTFGMLVDKFGTKWMVNIAQKK